MSAPSDQAMGAMMADYILAQADAQRAAERQAAAEQDARDRAAEQRAAELGFVVGRITGAQ